MNIFRFALTAVLASVSVGYVAAYPDGAGGCPAGRSAPGIPHRLFKEKTTGSLSEGGFNVTIDGQTPAVDNKVTTNNLDFAVVVTATDELFKGILIRVSNTDPDEVIPGDDLAVASACRGRVGSATHTSRDKKTSGTATLELSEYCDHKIDISVVVQNSDGVSIFYYTGYEVIVDSATSRGLFERCKAK
jgi:hypothetical protein